MSHNRPSGKDAPPSKRTPRNLTEADRRKLIESGGAVAMGAFLGMAEARYGAIELTPESKGKLISLASDLSVAPGMLGSFARGALNGMIAHEVFAMGAKFAAQAKAKEESAAKAADPLKCHACGYTLCACDPWKGPPKCP